MKQPCNAHAYEQEAKEIELEDIFNQEKIEKMKDIIKESKERAYILMRLKAGYKPIHKFNNGNYATLCNKCNVVISTGINKDQIMCESCINEIEVKLKDEDKE
jgi:hypothetical protein